MLFRSYESLDLEEWNYRGEMSSSFPMGYMWECPDYFELGNGLYLSVSPQGLPTEEYHFNNVYQSGYFRWNTEEDRCECFIEWDMGFDFYAPQTFELPDQRRVMFGWMGMPDAEYGNPLTVKAGWQHCLTLPREITHRNDRLCQMPVKELESLRGERVELTELQCFDMGTTFELLCEGIDDQNDFELMLSKVLLVHYCATNQSMEISFADSISGGGRTIRKAIVFRLINIHVYADVSSVEIFINDGEFVFTTRYYPSEYGVRIMTKDCQCSCWKIRENLL